MKIRLIAGLSVLALISSTLVACGGTPNKEKSENPEDYYEKATEGEKAFSSVTTFDEPVEFHTPEQKDFLAYDEKPYEDLTKTEIQNRWAKDNTNNDYSKPLPIEISFEHNDSDVKQYSLEISRDYKFQENVIMQDIDATENKFSVYNLFSGTDYYYKVKAVYDDGYAVSATNKLTTVGGIRNLYVDGMVNCRDMGGKATVDGGYIKQGLIYRTAAMDDNKSPSYQGASDSVITEAGKKTMLQDLKVKTEIELRGGPNGLDKGESKNRTNSVLGDSVKYEFKGMAYNGGKNLLFRNIELVRQVFDVLGDEENYPIFYHCRIGTDRTGLVALLINGLCGLDVQLLYQDYLFSNFGRVSKNFGCKDNAAIDTVYGYISEIGEFPGEKFQNKVYNFLLAAGVPAEKLDTVIRVLTTEGSVKDNDSSKTHVADYNDIQETGASARVLKKNLRQPEEAIKMATVGDGVKYEFTSDKEFTCDLFANLMSNYTTGNLNDQITVKLNGSEIEVANTALATESLGFDSSIECWIPAKLASITVPAGNNTIELEVKTTLGGKGLQISQFAFSGMSVNANIQ